jgi:hypothetical protein
VNRRHRRSSVAVAAWALGFVPLIALTGVVQTFGQMTDAGPAPHPRSPSAQGVCAWAIVGVSVGINLLMLARPLRTGPWGKRLAWAAIGADFLLWVAFLIAGSTRT